MSAVPPSVNTTSTRTPTSSSLTNSPVASIPFIRRLFVTDPATLPSSSVSSAAQSKPFRRHSFDLGTVIWTEHSFTSTTTATTSPSPVSHSATSTPTAQFGRPLQHVTAGHQLPAAINAADIAQGSPATQKAPKLLERLCRQEWDFS